MEILKAIGDAFEDMHQIHKASKATIGLLVDSESNLHRHSFIDLVGTVEQVKTAEELILDKILKAGFYFKSTYSLTSDSCYENMVLFRFVSCSHVLNCMQTYQGPVFPVILMPPTVYGHEIRLHVDKVARLLGENGSNALAIEVVSGAWLQVDDQPPAGGPKHERRVNVYGPKAHVFKAVSLIHSQVYEAGESLEAEDELEMLFKELSFDEMMAGMKSRNPQMADCVGAASASGSGKTEEEKEQHVEDAKDKDKSEGEKLQQDEDVKVAEDKDESKGKAKQQHEEDVKEAVSGEVSETKASVEQLD
ncbi:putative K domain-containing protein [Helianthus anomalus]